MVRLRLLFSFLIVLLNPRKEISPERKEKPMDSMSKCILASLERANSFWKRGLRLHPFVDHILPLDQSEAEMVSSPDMGLRGQENQVPTFRCLELG